MTWKNVFESRARYLCQHVTCRC